MYIQATLHFTLHCADNRQNCIVWEQVYIIHLKKNSDCTKGVNVNWCRSSIYVVVSTAILVGVLELTITAVYQYRDMNTYYGVLNYWLRSFKLDVNINKFFFKLSMSYGNFDIFCNGIVKTKQKVLELLKKESKLSIIRNLLRLNIDHFFH